MDQICSIKRFFLVHRAFALVFSSSFGPLLTRFYFVPGFAKHNTWLQTAIHLFPFLWSYCARRRRSHLFRLKPSLLAAFGALTGLANYLYPARLPVSTSSLLLSSVLAQTAVFAYLFMKHKSTAYSMNATYVLIFLLVVGLSAVEQDRPAGEVFGMLVATVVVFGGVVPEIERRWGVVWEVELVMALGLVAMAFRTVGLLAIEDFEAVARALGLGEAAYFAVVVSSAVLFQGVFLGREGVVYSSSALLAGGGVTMLLVPGGNDTFLFLQLFRVEKAVSLFLALWVFNELLLLK